jgi:hypothetical protein
MKQLTKLLDAAGFHGLFPSRGDLIENIPLGKLLLGTTKQPLLLRGCSALAEYYRLRSRLIFCSEFLRAFETSIVEGTIFEFAKSMEALQRMGWILLTQVGYHTAVPSISFD